jgi:aryl-alcohol dehydrogenase-like predicted oxidoreductase
MQQRRLGDATVGAIGLGAMPMSFQVRPERAQSISTIHAALDEGVTLIDTADAYTPDDRPPGHNEELVAEALAAYGRGADDVMVATKGGHTRDGAEWNLNGRPDYLRKACEASLRRLRVEAIGLYQHHRPDPAVPYEDTIGALKGLLEAGLVVRAGISNADVDQIGIAAQILGAGLVAVQNEFSPKFRSSETELALCAELGVAFLPWSPLGGSSSAKDLGSAYRPFAEVGKRHDVSPQRVCLAWMLAKSPVIIPIPGASRPATIRDSAAATNLELSAEEIDELDATR